MRRTYSQLLTYAQNATGGDTSASTTTFLKQRIAYWYGKIKTKTKGYSVEATRTFSTVADQQFYHIPPGLKEITSLEITISSVKHPLNPVFSYDRWNKLNAIQIQATALPRNYFRRRDDFGIYPIPQATYTGTITYILESQPIFRTDYTTGTVSSTENSDQLTGSSTSWSGDVFANQWFSFTDSDGEPTGNWYRIESVDSETAITLETVFEESSVSGGTYVIGDSPELPTEAHELIYAGAVADYFAQKRQSPSKAQTWLNYFYTGDFNNSSRDPERAIGGLLALIEDHMDRDDSQLVERVASEANASDIDLQVWGTTLS